ncbi:MAG: hypothetical protein ABH872_00380 [Candidatus Omnitrophota bacterium]
MVDFTKAETIVFLAVFNLLAVGVLLNAHRNKKELKRNKRALVSLIIVEAVLIAVLFIKKLLL